MGVPSFGREFTVLSCSLSFEPFLESLCGAGNYRSVDLKTLCAELFKLLVFVIDFIPRFLGGSPKYREGIL